jgi:uncharacterized protein (DUF697 family)
MALPLDIRELASSSTKLRAEREKPVRLAVFIDAEAPDAAVEALKLVLRPQMSTARLHIEPVVPGDILVVDDNADAVIALTGPGSTLTASLARSRDRFIPTAVIALGEERDFVASRLEHPILDTFTSDDATELVGHVGTWLADRVSGKRLALAANFAFVRRAVAIESIKSTAFQNGVIGGVMIIPGADMPLMTANQAKMLMQIAAAYGEPLGVERIKELAAVVGGAFALRTAARQVLTLVPGFGWAIKAGIGYSGTLAMGYAALEYFEGGGDVRGLADRVRDARDRAVESARKRGRSKIRSLPEYTAVIAPSAGGTDGPGLEPTRDEAELS